MKNLKVKTIEKDGEPDGEVLAIGYQDEMLIGWVSENMCESASEILEDVTAYIEIKDLVKIFSQ